LTPTRDADELNRWFRNIAEYEKVAALFPHPALRATFSRRRQKGFIGVEGIVRRW
jgi:hypothetical protein